jgi:hypothetical protein
VLGAAGWSQCADHGAVMITHCKVQGRKTKTVKTFHVCVVVDQKINHVEMISLSGEMEGGPSVVVACINVCSACYLGCDFHEVSSCSGVEQSEILLVYSCSRHGAHKLVGEGFFIVVVGSISEDSGRKGCISLSCQFWMIRGEPKGKRGVFFFGDVLFETFSFQNCWTFLLEEFLLVRTCVFCE